MVDLRQSPSGPNTWTVESTLQDLGTVNATSTAEVSFAAANLRASSFCISTVLTDLSDGLIFSGVRSPTDGGATVRIGNSSTGNVNAGTQTLVLCDFPDEFFTDSPSGDWIASYQRRTFDFPLIAANSNEGLSFSWPGLTQNDVVGLGWTNASGVISGFAIGFSHAYCDGPDSCRVVASNVIASGVDPGGLQADLIAFRRTISGDRPRRGPSGMPRIQRTTVTIDHTSIGGRRFNGASASLALPIVAGVGSMALVSPRTALPAGIVLSGASIRANDTIQVVLGNCTAGAIDPPSIEYDVLLISMA